MSTVTPLCAHHTLTDQASDLPVYHTGGLLPPFPDLSTLIRAPHPFGWGIRSLSRSELLQAYDIGDRFSSLLPASYSPSGCAPVSTYAEALKRLSPLIAVMRGGGVYTDSSGPRPKESATGSKPNGIGRRIEDPDGETNKLQDLRGTSVEKDPQGIAESSLGGRRHCDHESRVF